MNAYYNEEIFPNKYKKEIINTQPMKQYIEQNNIQYIKDIIENNKGKKIQIYLSFPNIKEQKQLNGILEQSGRDYITVSEPQTGQWHILPIEYINYITFEENINYN